MRIEGTSYANPEVLADQMATRPGEAFNVRTLHRDLTRLYGRGDMELIDYRLVDEGGSRGLIVEVQEKSWGPNYLRFGISLSSDLHGDSEFKVLAGHKRAWVNSLGAEWRNDVEVGRLRRFATEFYQPLSVGDYLFASAYGTAQVRPELLFVGDKPVAEYSVVESRAGIDIGVPFGIYGEARLGYRYLRASGEPTVALPDFPDVRAQESGIRLIARWDSLDHPFFATRGFKGEGEIFSGRRSLRLASVDFDPERIERLQLSGTGSFSISKHGSIHVGGRLATLRSDRADTLSDYNLGGFLNLSGYRTDQLSGRHLALLRLVYTQRIANAPGLGGGGIYAGGSIEAGNVWGTRDSVSTRDLKPAASLFLAADTWFGPMYFAMGRASGNHQAFYIFLGRP